MEMDLKATMSDKSLGTLYYVLNLSDQYQYLGNCPPTPPLTQQQAIIDNKLRLMLG